MSLNKCPGAYLRSRLKGGVLIERRALNCGEALCKWSGTRNRYTLDPTNWESEGREGGGIYSRGTIARVWCLFKEIQ